MTFEGESFDHVCREDTARPRVAYFQREAYLQNLAVCGQMYVLVEVYIPLQK